jgi:predicted nucleic acid-binding protein
MTYLIDTDWVIDHLNHIERVTRCPEELAPEGLALSIISLAELYSEAALQHFLNPELTILGLDEETCKSFGKERSRL